MNGSSLRLREAQLLGEVGQGIMARTQDATVTTSVQLLAGLDRASLSTCKQISFLTRKIVAPGTILHPLLVFLCGHQGELKKIRISHKDVINNNRMPNICWTSSSCL